MPKNHFILTLSCPDTLGVVFRVSDLIFRQSGNILDSAQFGDDETGLFFMRVHFSMKDSDSVDKFRKEFTLIADEFRMHWELFDASRKSRVLVLVSKFGHCLNDLLFRSVNQQLPIEIVAVISNHDQYRGLVSHHEIPFYYLPITAETKAAQERQILSIFHESRADFVVLARYMQILSPDLCQKLSGKIINIHHSFLPSFKGSKPYTQAHSRGVKLIGATAHYVTTDLDEGPIIEQDTERVDHSYNPEELSLIGNDIESRVLARAVKWHAEHRVAINGQKTVVFR